VAGGVTDPLKAVIIAVGSEMLTPTRTDTNSLFATEVLNGLGIEVAYKAIVGDDREELAAAVSLALERHRAVILTGGLGPTDDDVTRDVVASHLGLALDEDPAIVESIRARFAARGLAMPEVNRRQAMVPRGARVLENPRGSAPGLLIEAGRQELLPTKRLLQFGETRALCKKFGRTGMLNVTCNASVSKPRPRQD
jgi:nicotinamide-nucleotide amidase